MFDWLLGRKHVKGKKLAMMCGACWVGIYSCRLCDVPHCGCNERGCRKKVEIYPLSKSAFTRKMYADMDEERKKKGEVWHYECYNGHTWQSYSSPTGSFCADNYGMEQTACPECGTEVCKGDVYRNGKKTTIGAFHIGFTKKRKKRGNR